MTTYDPSLRIFAKLILVHFIKVLLWTQFGSKHKYQTAADDKLLLPFDEVSAVNIVADGLGLDTGISTIYPLFCRDSSYYYTIGVSCDCSFNNNTECHVNKISWSNKGLNGFLPEEVAKITYLNELDLSHNEITGSIPDVLGNMSQLYRLDLSNNKLTGQIPKSLGNLKAQIQNVTMGPSVNRKLTENRNRCNKPGCSGSEGANPNIPCNKGQPYCSGGRYDRAKCSKGQLYGRSCFTETRKQPCPFFTLDLSNNHLDGSIPESIGNIKVDPPYDGEKMDPHKFCHQFSISLHDNRLTGRIPKSFGNLKLLTSLYLQKNLLNSSIPSSLSNLSRLLSLSLNENQLDGFIPPELGNLTSLQYLLLQSNYFTGNLPTSFGRLANLYTFSISGNYLSGPFPDFITNWTYISTLSLYGNNFGGNIPPQILNFSGSLQTLTISDVGNSSFQFPPSLTQIPFTITTLVLRNCSVSGSIPSYIGNNKSLLQYLDLSFNNLSGQVPDSLEILNLTYMSFADNLLEGPIPSWISRAARWTKIDLSFNYFSNISGELRRTENLNIFSCCRACDSKNCTPEMRDVDHLAMKTCPDGKPKYHSLYINCGGEEIPNLYGHHYDNDNTTSLYGVSSKGNWAFSSTGSFLSSTTNKSDYIKTAKCGISVAEAPLYQKARLAPVSLKYYGLCLYDGSYNVTLHFSEILFVDDEDHNDAVKKRIFDVYIQGEKVSPDFNINTKAVGPEKVALVENHTVHVNNSRLEIHLYWAGKGSSGDSPDYNGPLLSAISVNSEIKSGRKLSGAHIAMITMGSIIFATLLLIGFAWIMGWLEKEEMHDIKVGENETVTVKQLVAATRRFSKDMEIGSGTFGTVYKAELSEDRIVAVKKLSTLSGEGIEKLKNEISNLQTLRNENLVRLFDIHVGKDSCFLVYEYMENKSLADVLFDPEHKMKLDWNTRFNICLGIAKGLKYLHEGRPTVTLVHRGIKAANILLDRNLKPKISDFGLAGAYAENENDASQLLRIMKTESSNGYMAPEYRVIGKESSCKIDVYSFGVVILEIVSGRKNISAGHKNSQELEILVDEVWKAERAGRLMILVDQSLSSYETKQVMTVLKLAVQCTNISAGVRPTMSEVVSVLTFEKSIEEISMPAALKEAHETDQDSTNPTC